MQRHARRQLWFRLGLITSAFLVLSVCIGAAHALSGSIPGSVSSGSVYYKVGGWTDLAYFKIDFSSGKDLQLRLFDDEGNLIATGSSPTSTSRELAEYLSGGYTYYVVITLLSGTGPVSFTLTYQDVYTIVYDGTTSPFPLGDEPLIALAIGGPIILGVGFALILIFGRMKIRQRKSEISLGAPAQLINLAPATPAPQAPVQKPAPVSSPPTPATPPKAGVPTIKYCPYCGSDVTPGSKTCKGCGNTLI